MRRSAVDDLPSAPASSQAGQALRTPDSLQEMLARQAAEQATHAHQVKKQRDRGPLKVLAFFLLAAGAGYVGWNFEELKAKYLDKTEESPADESADVPANAFPVDTPQMHFELPSAPNVTTYEVPVMGVQAAATSWESVVGSTRTTVLSLEFPGGTASASVTGGYAGMIDSMVQQSAGTIESQRDEVVAGETIRTVVIDTGSGRVFAVFRHNQQSIVALITQSGDSVEPPSHIALVDSFRFV